ncbi:MAG: hypothetical protein QHH02_03030 [Syntrophomonadaceae bacterium]|nr:hypothetical protein [Syntrophomonadaceae bacterium]
MAVDERDTVACPACGAAKPRQLFSNVGIIRRASGGGGSASSERSCESCDQRFG